MKGGGRHDTHVRLSCLLTGATRSFYPARIDHASHARAFALYPIKEASRQYSTAVKELAIVALKLLRERCSSSRR